MKSDVKTDTQTISVVPLGGFGEIGKNCFLLEGSRDIIMVDCGVTFPDPEEHPGVNYLIPDFMYVLEREDLLRAIVVTHAHEDHIGAIPYLLKQLKSPVPIYGTRFTLAMIQRKLSEHDLTADLIEVNPDGDETYRVGETFTIEPFRVTHSVPDAVGYAFDTPAGLIVHTGDFKFDKSPIDGRVFDLDKLLRFRQREVRALICDTTSVVHPGTAGSEKSVGGRLRPIIRAASQLVVVTTFASNLHRIQQVCELALESGRKVAVSGRSMEEAILLGLSLGYLNVPASEFLSADQVSEQDPRNVLVLTTGSQGEPLSGLVRAATNSHKDILLQPGDTVVFSAKVIPGNEKYFIRLANLLTEKGINLVTPKEAPGIHVSGHAYSDEVEWMITLLKPEHLIPFHGEAVHTQTFSRLADALSYPNERIHILRLGQSLVIASDGCTMGPTVQTGVQYVDGESVGETGHQILMERLHLRNEGIVMVVVNVDSQRQLKAVEVVTRGLVYTPSRSDFAGNVKRRVTDLIKHLLARHPYERILIKSHIRHAVLDYVYKTTGRRPMIVPVILDGD